jgi:hypothetical protein
MYILFVLRIENRPDVIDGMAGRLEMSAYDSRLEINANDPDSPLAKKTIPPSFDVFRVLIR